MSTFAIYLVGVMLLGLAVGYLGSVVSGPTLFFSAIAYLAALSWVATRLGRR